VGVEVPRKEISKFALALVGVLRAAAKGVVFIPKYSDTWTASDFNGVADLILENLREDKIDQLKELYQKTNGQPFDLWKVDLG
jgi:hypothetical protein